jgi:hypothetical protein
MASNQSTRSTRSYTNVQDEIAVCGILLSRSDAHLQAIAQQFP